MGETDDRIAAIRARLENDYAFECEGGPLRNCVEWHELFGLIATQAADLEALRHAIAGDLPLDVRELVPLADAHRQDSALVDAMQGRVEAAEADLEALRRERDEERAMRMLAIRQRDAAEDAEAAGKWVAVVGKGSFSSCYGTFASYDDAAWWLKSNGWITADCDVRPIRAALSAPSTGKEE